MQLSGVDQRPQDVVAQVLEPQGDSAQVVFWQLFACQKSAENPATSAGFPARSASGHQSMFDPIGFAGGSCCQAPGFVEGDLLVDQAG